jgi:hypothetical protein
MGGDGAGGSKNVSVDLALPAGGAATLSMVESLDLVAGIEPAYLSVRVSGVDAVGNAFTAPALEVPVSLMPSPDVNANAPDVTLIGVGDIAVCASGTTRATAQLLDRLPGTIATLGDHVYPNGSSEHFANCYDPSWGRHRSRTFPAPGNHDWDVDGGAPYFTYFGAGAGPTGLGYYSYNLGAWHILSLNSNVAAHPGSPQYEWVRRDLANSASSCTLAYWHHPLFSSGPNGNNPQMREMWRLLQSSGAEVVLTGHDHVYERFAPQDADGRPVASGLRQFVVGTGGVPLYQFKALQANSEVRESQTWGVLKLTLGGRRYSWEFVPIDGQSFRDAGGGDCR